MSEICTECLEGRLVPQSGKGRMFTYRRGSKYELPADFEVPTCDACGALFFDEPLREAARAVLKPEYLTDQRTHLMFLVETIHAKAGVSNRDVERACGVTPTYLSHLLKGRKEASEPLIALLEAFAIHPAEVHRRLQREGAHDTTSVRAAVHAEKEILWREPIHAWSPAPEYDFDFEAANDVRAA